ncbi:MAG: class II aldolase/adducin family protein [Methylococcaceae bacterium]|nr:class II aldolase/adducin family protein [Methylococcaceae bacterium]MCI0668076.1 class II aldolase/adducin family protein [Methylococcaceae bacterium]MCI0734392.1 class II aldolase/adducin family protein [Methylococcaceae bacterium]
MKEQEGVIKFDLVFEQKPFPETLDLRTLIAWRTLLYKLGLIGQDPRRYGGLGFGNISQRIEEAPDAGDGMSRFIISGTQTGSAERLDDDQFCIVTAASIRENRIVAEGPVKPSSEALTHAAVYHGRPEVRVVMHVHSPELWRATHRLGIPSIGRTVAYGTPEMADRVHDLISSPGKPSAGIFSMLGHEDGIVSYANAAESAGNLLIDALARALTFG